MWTLTLSWQCTVYRLIGRQWYCRKLQIKGISVLTGALKLLPCHLFQIKRSCSLYFFLCSFLLRSSCHFSSPLLSSPLLSSPPLFWDTLSCANARCILFHQYSGSHQKLQRNRPNFSPSPALLRVSASVHVCVCVCVNVSVCVCVCVLPDEKSCSAIFSVTATEQL